MAEARKPMIPDDFIGSPSEALYRQIMGAVGDGVCVTDRNLEIIMHNAAFSKFCTRIGAHERRLIGRRLDEVCSNYSSEEKKRASDVLTTGTPATSACRFAVGAEEVVAEISHLPVKSGGEVTHLLVVMRDVTASYKAADELRAGEEKYRLLVESAFHGIAIFQDNRIPYANESMARIAGCSREEIMKMPLPDFLAHLHPKDHDIAVDRIRRRLKGENTPQPFRLRINDFQGKLRWLETYSTLITHDGRPALQVAVLDITDRLFTEQALRESEERHRLIIDNVMAAIAVFDYDGRLLFANETCAATVGRRLEDLIGQNQTDIFPTDKAKTQMKAIRAVIDGNRPLRQEAMTFLKGQWRWYEINIQPYTLEGRPTALLIAHDIHEKKTAEQTLRESEERFRAIFTTAQDSIFIKDKNLKYVQVNPAMEKLFGCSAGDLLQKTDAELFGEEAARQLNEMDKRVLAGEVIEEEHSKYIQGVLRAFHVIKVPMRDSAGQVIGVCGIARDVTEKDKAREELRHAHDELEKRVRERTEDLHDVNQRLGLEQEALRQKNIALQEVLSQFETAKQQMASQIKANVERIILPALTALENRHSATGKQYITLLRNNLQDIVSPFVNTLESRFARLTPREVEICNMIKGGLSCKDIAVTLNISVQTILKQRAIIRKKLGLTGQKINLTSFLISIK